MQFGTTKFFCRKDRGFCFTLFEGGSEALPSFFIQTKPFKLVFAFPFSRKYFKFESQKEKSQRIIDAIEL